MTLTELIKADAKWATDSNIDVEVERSMGTVCITCPDYDDIFMQGYGAELFIAACDETYKWVQDLGMDVVELALAKPYAESIWG